MQTVGEKKGQSDLIERVARESGEKEYLSPLFQPHFHGLRGVAAIIVLFGHFTAAFYEAAYSGDPKMSHIGWDVLFSRTPLDLPISGCFAVSLFFVLSGYVLTLPYMTPQRDAPRLCAAIFKRPIRLSGIVFFTMLLSYILNREGFYFNTHTAELTKSGWWAQLTPPLDFRQLFHDFVFAPFSSARIYSGPLWTIPMEFYGGVGSLLFALFFAQSRYRWLAYLPFLFLFRDQFYVGFIFGIFFADCYNNRPSWLSALNKPWLLGIVIILGIYFGGFPSNAIKEMLPWSWYAYLPQFPLLGGGYCMIGAVLIFVVVFVNSSWQAFFASPSLVYLGKISFALYAIHFVVLRSFSSWLFITLSTSLNYNIDFLITFACSLPLIILISHGMLVLVDKPSIRFANFLGKKLAQCLGRGYGTNIH